MKKKIFVLFYWETKAAALNIGNVYRFAQSPITCSKLTIVKLELGVKNVQS